MHGQTFVFLPYTYVSMYELVTCYTITPLSLIKHVAGYLKPIDGIFAVLSLIPNPGFFAFESGRV